MSYGWCSENDVVYMKHGEHRDLDCRVTEIDGGYIYVHPIGHSKQIIYEVYLNEIYPSLSYERNKKIEKLLK